MTEHRASVVAALTLLLAAACATRDVGQQDSAAVATAGSTQQVRLKLDSTIADLSPTGFAVTDSRLYVLEGMSGRVVELDRQGALVHIVGLKGSGPGEFQIPSAIAVLDNSVAIADAGLLQMKFFGRDDAKLRGQVSIPGATLSVTARGDTVVGGYLDAAQHTSLYSVAMGMTTPHRFGPLPEVLEKNPRVSGLYPFGVVSTHADGFVQGFSSQSKMQWLSARGAVTGDFDVPVSARRGVPADLVDRINNSEPRANLIDLTSNLMAMGQLPGDRIALVHVDYHKRTKGIGSSAFVSVVNGQGKSLCSDIRIPFDTTTARPTFAFHRDSLFVMQVVSDNTPAGSVAVSSMGLGRCV